MAATEAAAALCQDLGHAVDATTWPEGTGTLLARTFGIMAANVAATVDERLAALGRPLADDDLEPGTRAMFEAGRTMMAEDYAVAVRSMHAVGRLLAGFHETYDVILTPTLGQPPVPLGYLDAGAPTFRERIGLFVGFTQVFNATGQPAMSVPLGWLEREGAGPLPIGVQFAGRFGEEDVLFRLAAQLEDARPWWDRRAPEVAPAVA